MNTQHVDFENAAPVELQPQLKKKIFIKNPNERFSTYSHMFGAIASLIATIFMLVLSDGSRIGWGAILIFGLSNVILFSSSTACHSQTNYRHEIHFWTKVDHIAIFFLIAGTYTAISTIYLEGTWKIGIISAQWIFAGLGVILKIYKMDTADWVTGLIYLIQGWMLVFGWNPLVAAVPTADFILILTAGVVYSVGAVVFVTEKPKLWPGVFSSHDLWHIMVLTGAGLYMLVVFRGL